MSIGRLGRDGYYDVPPGKIAAVVTSLEMRTPPAGDPPPLPAGVAIERLKPVDPERYLRLFRAIGTPWLWFSRLRLSRPELEAIIHHPAVEVAAVRHGPRDIGLVELDFRSLPEVELAFFGLVPEWTGCGLGRAVLAQAIKRAFEGGAKRFWVHTCTLDHPKALAFYLRAGFVPFARSVEIADDPRLIGLLPRDAAPQVPLIP
jgi:GNAT superfamily N-acetyltransferase